MLRKNIMMCKLLSHQKYLESDNTQGSKGSPHFLLVIIWTSQTHLGAVCNYLRIFDPFTPMNMSLLVCIWVA